MATPISPHTSNSSLNFTEKQTIKDQKEFKNILTLLSSDGSNQSKYLAVKQGTLCKINFLELIWEKIKGIFLRKDATNPFAIKLTTLEWIAKNAKYIQSNEDYYFVESLAKQAGLIPAASAKSPQNIQELTQEIGKKLFSNQKQKSPEESSIGNHLRINKETPPEETTATLLDNFIIQYRQELRNFPEEVKKATQTFQNIYNTRSKDEEKPPKESEELPLLQLHKDNNLLNDYLANEEEKANMDSLNIEKEQSSIFLSQSQLALETIPTSSNQTKSLAERTIKKLTDHDLIKKHWKTAAVVTIIGIGAFLTYSAFFPSPSLPTELPEQLSANSFTQDPNLLLNYAAKNLKSPARKYIQKLTTPSNSFTCSALQCFAAHTYKNLTNSVNSTIESLENSTIKSSAFIKDMDSAVRGGCIVALVSVAIIGYLQHAHAKTINEQDSKFFNIKLELREANDKLSKNEVDKATQERFSEWTLENN